MFRLFIVLLAIGSASPAPAVDGNCAAPSDRVTDAICGNPGLAELDRELARIYALARAAAGDTAPALVAVHQAWHDNLRTCRDIAATPIGQCLTARYAARLHDLRSDVPGLSEDRDGASLGPFGYECSGIDGPVSAMFFNTGDPGVSLRWVDVALVLPLGRSASGARYAGEGPDGRYVFWTQDQEAMLTLPDGAGDKPCVEISR